MTTATAPSLTLVPTLATRKRRRTQDRQRRVTARHRRTAGQVIASLGASFLPIASFELAHVEAPADPMLWILVGAALTFSLPSVLSWAKLWTGNPVKAFGFAMLLEGTMVFAHTAWLNYMGLTILVLINAVAAWGKAKGK